MKMSLVRVIFSIAFLTSAQLVAVTAIAAGYDDHDALAGVKELKVVFDITAGDAKALLNRLNIIDETRRSLMQQGVRPYFVLSFRGPATKLVQTDQSKIRLEDRETAGKILAKLEEMRKAPGIENLEQCAVAIREQETRAEDVVPAVKVVGNAWISLMAYQSRGYAYIAP